MIETEHKKGLNVWKICASICMSQMMTTIQAQILSKNLPLISTETSLYILSETLGWLLSCTKGFPKYGFLVDIWISRYGADSLGEIYRG